MAVQETTNLSGTLDTRGTNITVSPARGAMQLVLDDSGGGGSARITNINGVAEGDGSTTSAAIPASGIATPLIVRQGLASITLVPSSTSVVYYLTPILFAGGHQP
jgi:hypothetical protein